MAANKVELQEAILRAVDAVVTQRNNELQLDKTISGTIKKNVGKRGGKPLYQVEYNGGIIEAVTQGTDDVYSPRMGVYVLVPQGNFSNEKIIIGRSANILTDRSASVVAAAVNNYSIVGTNLLKTTKDGEDIKTKQFGLRSFHPEFRDSIEGIDHRAQFLYRFNEEENPITFQHDKFNIYKNESTAIMIKADFLTNLDSVQRSRANARYGLIFNFAFDNLNKGYGETNGEILDNISKIVNGTIEDNSESGSSKQNLYDYVISPSGYFGERINSNPLGELIDWNTNNTGILDRTIEYINSIYQSFKVEDAKLDKEIIANTIQGFTNLLKELKTKENTEEIKNEYMQWRLQVVGNDAQKYVQFTLTSDDMMGNPFVFSTWNTQYAVFDIDLETFNHLDSILFYKEGFLTDTKNSETGVETVYEYNWPIGLDGDGGPDIFVRNLQIYAMNPLDNQSGDYTLNVEPYAGLDIVLSSENPRTQFKATLLRKFYEDLTANGKTNFYWFKEDSSIINTASKNYNYLGGTGWKKIEHNETNYLFTTTLENNHAYKNNYKCVAVYEPSADDKTVLSFTFTVYNKDMSTDVKLESDLGTKFSFDAGTPTIKVLINEDRINNTEDYQELGFEETNENPKYLYCWTVNDAANGYVLFLDELNEVLVAENAYSKDAYILSSKEGLLKRIKTYILEKPTTKTSYATRIQYPVSIAISGFTITCYVKQLGSDGIYYDIGSASLEFENQNESIAAGYRIHIINGDQVFQYDEYGKTPCSDTKKNPLTVKPLQAKLFTPSGLEVEGTNYQVEWILPIEDTMIATSESLILNPSTGLNQSYIGPELSFSIDELYDPNAYANQITCHIHFGEEDYYKDTNFYFGKQGGNGTNGTDTVAKINCTLSDPTNILHYQPLTLYLQKEENDNVKGMLNIGNKRLEENITLAHVEYSNSGSPTQSGPLQLFVYQKEEEVAATNFKTGYPKWNLAGNISETKNNTSTIFALDSSLDGQSLIWNNTKIENAEYRLQNIKASVQLNDDQMYYAFFSLPVIEYEQSSIPVSELISTNRVSIDKNSYLNEIIYNADGRYPIYNHNQGLRLYNIPDNITKIKWIAKGGLVPEENDPWILLLEEKKSDNGQLEIETIPQNNSSMIYVLPKDIFDGSATNNRIEAELYSEDQLIATVYAPINMTLNTFGLTSLNAWDGNTVTIDEEGGYIMAPQIGAGEKDNNNRFTGILMGKTEVYTGGAENEKEIGLFGYSHGLQSIFLDSQTGNAYFGLPDVENTVDENNNPIKTFKNTSRVIDDDYNEGRIELIPGGVSKIGGWRLGRRSLYYTDSGDIEDRYIGDYVPEKNSGVISQISPEPYSGHHEKDIGHKDSGILLHSGESPYFSIKGPVLKKDDIEIADLGTYLRTGDSLEIQLDPKAPTLFTVFRHNGDQWKKQYYDEQTQTIETKTIYEEDTRTYLAGINGKGEFVANSVSSIIQLNENEKAYATNFSVNSFRAFNDIIDQERRVEVPQHTGFRMKIGNNILGQMFISNTGLNANLDNKDEEGNWINNPTLYITGGLTDSNGEYARPISINGKWIGLFAKDYNSSNVLLEETDANLKLQTNSFETNIGDTKFKLSRPTEHSNKKNDHNLLITGYDFKVNIGPENQGFNITIEVQGEKDTSPISISKEEYLNPEIYVSFMDENNQIYYVKKNSWNSEIKYILNDDDYTVFNKEKDICYKYGDQYFTETDLEYKYYKISNTMYIGQNEPRYMKRTEIDDTGAEVSFYELTTNPIVNGQYFKIPDSADDFTTDSNFVEITTSILSNNNQYIHSSLTNGYILASTNINKDIIYYHINNTYIESNDDLSDIVEYYLVQDHLFRYHYIPISSFGNYPDLKYTIDDETEEDSNTIILYEYNPDTDSKQYIYINQSFKQVQKIIAKKESYISTRKYSLFAGEYYHKIVTNETANKFITFSENYQGINLVNASGSPIFIDSENATFKLKAGDKYQFGFETDREDLFKEQQILGKFTIDDYNKIGLFMTSTWTDLTSGSNMQLSAPNKISIISPVKGGVGGNSYSAIEPQIILVAGGNETGITSGAVTTEKGTASELILNSSINGWLPQIKGKALKDRLSYPVFRVKTGYSDIGIYPEVYAAGGKDYYRENFYIRMPQYNSNGLEVQGKIPNSSYGLIAYEGGFFNTRLKVNSGHLTVTKGNNTKEGYITAEGTITTNKGFVGNGKQIINTMDGEGKSGNVPDIEGLGATGTITVLTVTENNGRPQFGTTSGKITMPTTQAIEAIANSAITAALGENGVIGKALKNYAKAGRYQLHHQTQDNIITGINKTSNTFNGNVEVDNKTGTFSINIDNLIGTISSAAIDNFYIEIE